MKNIADMAAKKYLSTLCLCHTLERLGVIADPYGSLKISRAAYQALCPF